MMRTSKDIDIRKKDKDKNVDMFTESDEFCWGFDSPERYLRSVRDDTRRLQRRIAIREALPIIVQKTREFIPAWTAKLRDLGLSHQDINGRFAVFNNCSVIASAHYSTKSDYYAIMTLCEGIENPLCAKDSPVNLMYDTKSIEANLLSSTIGFDHHDDSLSFETKFALRVECELPDTVRDWLIKKGIIVNQKHSYQSSTLYCPTT